jgi:TorA maturation chaperone TorD
MTVIIPTPSLFPHEPGEGGVAGKPVQKTGFVLWRNGNMESELGKELPILNLLRQVFLSEPSKEFLSGLAKVELSLESEEDGFRQMIEAAKKNRERLDSWIEELALEFSRLFIGPVDAPAVPFASFYLSEDRQVMSEETLAVRKKYLEAGVGLKNLYQVPDDHIGIELEFLYYLIREAIESMKTGKNEEAEARIRLRDEFTREHLAVWVPEFVDRILENSKEDFYRGAAILLRQVIEEYQATDRGLQG